MPSRHQIPTEEIPVCHQPIAAPTHIGHHVPTRHTLGGLLDMEFKKGGQPHRYPFIFRVWFFKGSGACMNVFLSPVDLEAQREFPLADKMKWV